MKTTMRLLFGILLGRADQMGKYYLGSEALWLWILMLIVSAPFERTPSTLRTLLTIGHHDYTFPDIFPRPSLSPRI